MHLDSYERAVEFKRKQRRITPPVYNASRLMERPFPDVSQPFVGDEDIYPEFVEFPFEPPGGAPTDDPTEDIPIFEPNDNGDVAIDENTTNGLYAVNLGGRVDNVIAGPSTAVEQNNVNVVPFDCPMAGNTSIIEQNGSTVELLIDVPIHNNEADPLQVKIENFPLVNADIAVEDIDRMGEFHVEKLDDGLEMYFHSDASFIPMQEAYHVKCNDPFSGNMPYSVDVSGHFYKYIKPS